ncbi:MAG: hypothetical protein ACM3O7_06590 [Acidobacteriota bacterium]
MSIALLACSLLAAASTAAAPPLPTAPPGELSAEVPALVAFHEVIYPLWHQAWPNRDLARIRELLPRVEEHVRAVEQAELPGILRDKRPAWDKGVAGLAEAAARYRAAVSADDGQAMLAAVELLHARYEALVRLVRPVMKELDAYHVVLYRIFHHDLPARRLGPVQAAAAELAIRCQALSVAEVPARFAPRRAALHEGIAQLCRDTASFHEATRLGQWEPIEAAVTALHTQYQSLEALFQ